MMKKLDIKTWKNIFRNLEEEGEGVEIVWLDNGKVSDDNKEWCLCYGEELFEDGFQSEQEASKRLSYLENLLIK